MCIIDCTLLSTINNIHRNIASFYEHFGIMINVNVLYYGQVSIFIIYIYGIVKEFSEECRINTIYRLFIIREV